MPSEIEARAKFDLIRYSQVWEDADLLVKALDIQSGENVLSIASAGDNAFALLAQNPAKVYAVDLNFSQIACCELRKVMYKNLSRQEHLLFGGVICGDMDRERVFEEHLKDDLSPDICEYWERNLPLIKAGFMTQGKFERYFALFRNRILPLIHNKKSIANLIKPKSESERVDFYESVWNNRRWRIMFKLFFSRFMMGRLGRDKEFFRFVEGSVADRILSRVKHALTALDPSENPYLHFILYGKYADVFPYALREENYEKIRQNLDKIEFLKKPIEEFAESFDGEINGFNLSDIFEYMTQDGMNLLYEILLQNSAKGARFAYWNMLAPRKCSGKLCEKYNVFKSEEQNEVFLKEDKAFFYSKFHLEKACE